MGQPEKNFIGQVFSEEEGAFAAAGRLVTHFVRCSPMRPGTKIEALTRERPKIVITRMDGRAGAGGTDHITFGIRTANPRGALEINATRRKPPADLLDTLETFLP